MTDINDQAIDTSATGNESSTVETNTQPVETHEAGSEPTSLRDTIAETYDRLMQVESPPKEPAVQSKTPANTQKVLTPQQAQANAPEGIDPVSGRPIEAIKAPQSLTPTLREKWGSVDRDFQKFWVERERQMQNYVNEVSEHKKTANEYRQVIAPYEKVIKDSGLNPNNVVAKLLEVNNELAFGSPDRKAQLIYNLISTYRPDPTVLQQLFAGTRQPMAMSAPPKPQAPVDIDAEVEKRIAERGQQQVNTSMDQAIHDFANDPANEFFNDVKETMGKIVGSGLVQGTDAKDLLSRAYQMAVQNHPEVAAVVAARQRAAAPASVAKPVGSAKPSLGASARSKAPEKKMNSREAVEYAWRIHSGE